MFKRCEFEAMYAKSMSARYGGRNDFYASYSYRVESAYIEERKNDLHKCLKNDIVFTGAWSDNMDERPVSKESLLPCESWVVTFPIGCYTVRFAAKGLYPTSEGETTATESTGVESTASAWSGNVTFEISARHNTDSKDVFAGGFKHVCQQAGAVTDYVIPIIDCICAARDKDSPDECASLFVLSGCWHKLSPDGEVVALDKSAD